MTEAACVINQSGIKPSRLCRRHGQSVFQKLKHNLTGRGGLRRHIIQFPETGVAFVVVNIDFLRCFLEKFRRIPQASLVTAVQCEKQLRKRCILRRTDQMSIRNQLIFIRIFFQNDLHLLPCLFQCAAECQTCADGIPIGVGVSCQRNRFRRQNPFHDFIKRVVCFFHSASLSLRSLSILLNNSSMWMAYSADSSSLKRSSGV